MEEIPQGLTPGPSITTSIQASKTYYGALRNVPRGWPWRVADTASWRGEADRSLIAAARFVQCRKPEPGTQMVPWYQAIGRKTKNGSEITALHWFQGKDHPQVVAENPITGLGDYVELGALHKVEVLVED